MAYASDAISPIYCFTTPMIPIYRGEKTGTGANISIHVRAFLCMEGGKAGRGCVPRRSPVCEVETTTEEGWYFVLGWGRRRILYVSHINLDIMLDFVPPPCFLVVICFI